VLFGRTQTKRLLRARRQGGGTHRCKDQCVEKGQDRRRAQRRSLDTRRVLPFQLTIAALLEWLERKQPDVIAFLREESHVAVRHGHRVLRQVEGSGVQNLTDTPTSHIYARSRMGCEVCWRVTSLSDDVVCTIDDDDEADVEVRAAFSDGTVVRTRWASNIETGRIVAALWLDAIQGEFAIR